MRRDGAEKLMRGESDWCAGGNRCALAERNDEIKLCGRAWWSFDSAADAATLTTSGRFHLRLHSAADAGEPLTL